MKVNLKRRVQQYKGGDWKPGVQDLPDDLAKEMLAAGFAEPIEAQKQSHAVEPAELVMLCSLEDIPQQKRGRPPKAGKD